MAGKTYAIHTQEALIKRVDQHAKRIRRSRNSLINEAIEMLLEVFDQDYGATQDAKVKKAGKK